MVRWPRGESEIEELVARGRLQRVTGAAAHGGPLLDKAGRTLTSAQTVREADPDNAYVLAYDAARHAGTALLVQQGLRPTAKGGHYVVEVAVRAQFGDDFREFGVLRRRRHELEYPTVPGDTSGPEEAAEAINSAREVLDAARHLLPQLGIF